MSKQHDYRQKLSSMLDTPDEIETLLMRESGLPGPRANLELAASFANLAKEIASSAPSWVPRLLRWASLHADQAPANHPREFLPFVAVQCLGALHTAQEPPLRSRIETALRNAANDPRWRMREACALGLQQIGTAQPDDLLTILRGWMKSPSLLDLRAVLATLADPPVLETPSLVAFALESADFSLTAYAQLTEEQRQSNEAKALRKALEFAPSVFASQNPKDGFRLLEAWADLGNLTVAKVLAANLRKARLARHYPDEVTEVGLRLQASFPE